MVPTSIPVIFAMASPILASPMPCMTSPIIFPDGASPAIIAPMAVAVIPLGGAIAPGNPPAKDGFAITIAPIIIPDSLMFSGMSKACGPASAILFANEPFISVPF